MYLPHERQRSRSIMAYIYISEAFKTSVSYSMPLKILLNSSEEELKYKYVHIAQRGSGCCSPFSTPFAAACIPSLMPGEQSTQLHNSPIHTVAASRPDIYKENSKHLDLKYCFICNVFYINSIKSTVLPT